MPETTARIRAKGLDATGVTEDQAERLWAGGAGKYSMAIVELCTEEPHGPNTEGKKRIDLVLTMVEPALADKVADHLRELARALARHRRTDDELPGLDGGLSVDDVINDGAAVIERDEDGKVVGVWNGDPDAPTSEQVWGDGYPEGATEEPDPQVEAERSLQSVPDPFAAGE